MTDNELLELAAKAAEINGVYVEENRMIREFCFKKYEYIRADSFEWNPLVNDGDALRLAVKLGMAVSICDGVLGFTVILGVYDSESNPIKEPHYNDPHAATRRAIVRAAAEIGKDMK